MLFHVTASHTPEECPGYNTDRMPEFLGGAAALQDKAKELNIKVHFMVNAAPEHVMYALLEANDPYSVALFLTSVPFKQDFKVTAVEHQQVVAQRAKEYYGIG